MRETLSVLNDLAASGTIGEYAIGGAVGATFYLEAWQKFEQRYLRPQ